MWKKYKNCCSSLNLNVHLNGLLMVRLIILVIVWTLVQVRIGCHPVVLRR